MACTSSNRQFSSVLIVWSIKGLASLPVIPDKRSIDTKHSGYNLYVCKMGPVHRSDSSAVGVFPIQDVLLLQENFPTWTSDSIVTMTPVRMPATLIIYYYMHNDCCYLTCIYASEMHVLTSIYIMYSVTINLLLRNRIPSIDLVFPKIQVGGR